SEPGCEAEITMYSSVTLKGFLSDSNALVSGDNTVVIANVAEFEVFELVKKLTEDPVPLQGTITCLIFFPELSARIYQDILTTSTAQPAFAGSERQIVGLHKISAAWPLTFESVVCLVDLPGKFQNISVKAVGMPSINPFQLETRTINGSFEFTGGFNFEIINYLADALNFTILPVRGSSYIGLARNGSLTGIGAQVVTGEADIAISTSDYLPYRQERISYLHSTFHSPPATSFQDVFFSIFDVGIWLSLVLSWTLLSVLTKTFPWLKHGTGEVSKNDKDVGNDAILFVTGAACQQGWHISPNSVSLRLIVLTSFITHIVCYAAFTATLVSMLSVDQQLIRDSSDLAKYQYRIYSDGTADHLVHKLEGKPLNDSSLANRTVSFIDGFKRMYSQKAGLISFSVIFYPQLKAYLESIIILENTEIKSQEKICTDIQQVSATRLPLKTGTIVRKHSPLKPYFNQKIVLLLERGIRHRFLTLFLRGSVGRCGKAPTETVPIEFKDPLDGLNEFLLQSRNLNGSFKFTSGFELEVIRYLAQALNFSIEHIRGNGWIGRGKNGSLTGIGAQVLSGEADISMTSCEYHPYRQEKISYLQPTYSSSIFAYIVSKPSSTLRDIFFSCFEVRIWLSLVSFWILSSLLTKSFARLKRSAEKVSRNDEDIGKDAILFVTGAACQQGWYISPDSISMRLIVLSSFITHMVFYAAFTAMLVSLLSIDQKLIRDSSDLTKYQFKMYSDEIVLSAGYFVHKLEGKPTKDTTQLADRNIPVQEGFLKIYSERSGIISIPDFFYSTLRSYLQTIFSTGNKETQIQEKICKDIQQVYITRVPLRAGLVLPKNSPLKPYLDQKVVLLMESGVRHRFSTAFFRNSVVQCGRAVVEKETIGIKNVWTAMLILISGFLASGCFVFAETILFRLFARNVML
ncbi:unnamed protein product, partial [Allacma fusca]